MIFGNLGGTAEDFVPMLWQHRDFLSYRKDLVTRKRENKILLRAPKWDEKKWRKS